MEIRKIRPEENVYSSMIATIAFVGKEDFTEQLKKPLEHTDGYKDTWAAFDGDRMISRMSVHPFEVSFDGQIVKMAGIGGVSTLPEDRNKGSVREILRKAMQCMLEQEQIFSFLFPFSHAYYRKFGYELSFTRRVLTIPLPSLRFLKNNGSLRFFQKEDAIDELADIYGRFIQSTNLMLNRSEKHWEDKVREDPYAKNIYTYIWRNAKGEPKSYIIFQPETEDGDRCIYPRDFIWADREGLLGMLGSLPVFYPTYKNLLWHAPAFVNMHTLLREPYDITEKRTCHGMNRVVDAKKVMERMRYPNEEGRAVIRLTDAFLPYNDGVYELTWSGRRGHVEKTSRDEGIDMAMDIQGLTQLVTGFCTPEDTVFAGKAEIFSNQENIAALFPRKNLYISDFF